jgi:hypothetical protein
MRRIRAAFRENAGQGKRLGIMVAVSITQQHRPDPDRGGFANERKFRPDF